MLPELQKRKVAKALHNLGYDFNHFVLMDFVEYVAAQRGKKISLMDVPLSDDMFAAWITTEEIDYILVSETTHAVHRTHNILHEIAHMVLDHPPFPVNGVLPSHLLRRLHQDVANGHARCVRSNRIYDIPEEREAEEFVFQIRNLVSHANRLSELIGTSIPSLRTIFDGQDD